jgi:hypothetical protein
VDNNPNNDVHFHLQAGLHPAIAHDPTRIDRQKATESLESKRLVYYPYCNNFFFPELAWRIFV